MKDKTFGAGHAIVLEQFELDVDALCRASRCSREWVVALVDEGALSPLHASGEWRFDGDALRRARRAAGLLREFELNAAGLALALDLLDRIDGLTQQLGPKAR
jgi:chaperone modulatory protein CbpM